MSPEPARGRYLALAVEAVTRAGAMQLARRAEGVHVTEKALSDIVTDVDVAVEEMFRALIAERAPGDGVLAEEMPEAHAAGRGPSRRWLFDPIDGTANFASQLPFFCASLALEVDGAIAVAAVYEPTRAELFSAERGRGAWLNGRPLRVSSASRLSDAMVGCGFPHGARSRVPEMERLVSEFAVRVRGFRRLGSAALDLCYVAAGRLDGFWDRNLKAWDLAAGALIVEEAGGSVSALDGGVYSCHTGQILASNGRIHRDMLEIMASART